MKWEDIPKLTSVGNYESSYNLKYFVLHIEDEVKEGLVLNPDFQRGHVWTKEQQERFIEFYLMGGNIGTIYFNAPNWTSVSKDGTYVCVDGLQRTTAFIDFYYNRVKAFGHYFNEFDGKFRDEIGIKINVNNLKTKAEVLKWYIEMNGAGTPHSESELDRVREMLNKI